MTHACSFGTACAASVMVLRLLQQGTVKSIPSSSCTSRRRRFMPANAKREPPQKTQRETKQRDNTSAKKKERKKKARDNHSRLENLATAARSREKDKYTYT